MIVAETTDKNLIAHFQNLFGFDWGQFSLNHIYFVVLDQHVPVGLYAFENAIDYWVFHAFNTKKCRGKKALYSALLATDMMATCSQKPIRGYPKNKSHAAMYTLGNYKRKNDYFIYEA